ncbi:MAG TPA: hypothetical protein VGO40_17395 [Longimicrobium sp.]|nr:hypothetical protein [Longimicrobium sp.]
MNSTVCGSAPSTPTLQVPPGGPSTAAKSAIMRGSSSPAMNRSHARASSSSSRPRAFRLGAFSGSRACENPSSWRWSEMSTSSENRSIAA